MPATIPAWVREYSFTRLHGSHSKDRNFNIYRLEKFKPKSEEPFEQLCLIKLQSHRVAWHVHDDDMHETLLQGQTAQVTCCRKPIHTADVIFPYPASHLITSADRFMGLVRLDLTSAAFRPTSETHSWTGLRAREAPTQLDPATSSILTPTHARGCPHQTERLHYGVWDVKDMLPRLIAYPRTQFWDPGLESR
jgi:hypothetical protein